MGRRVAIVSFAVVSCTVSIAACAPWPIFRALRGQTSAWIVMAVSVVALAATVVLALRRSPWAIVGVAAPQIAALVATPIAARPLDTALASIVGNIASRVVAEGTAELAPIATLADLFGAACAMTMALGLAQSGARARSALVAGAAWLVAVAMVAALTHTEGSASPALRVWAFVLVALAVAIAWAGDASESALVAFGAVAATFLVVHAIGELERGAAFHALALRDLDPTQRARVLAHYVSVRAHVRVALAMTAALGAITFVVARGWPRHHLAHAASFGAAIALAAALDWRSLARRVDRARDASDVGVSLPRVTTLTPWGVGDDHFVVKRDGSTTHVSFEDPEDEAVGDIPGTMIMSIGLIADRDVSCGTLAAALAPYARRRHPFALAAVREDATPPPPFAGELDPLLGRGPALDAVAFDLVVHDYPSAKATLDAGTLSVRLHDDPRTITFDLATDPDELARAVAARTRPFERRATVELTVRAADSVQRLTTALALLTQAFPLEGQPRYFALRVAAENAN